MVCCQRRYLYWETLLFCVVLLSSSLYFISPAAVAVSETDILHDAPGDPNLRNYRARTTAPHAGYCVRNKDVSAEHTDMPVRPRRNTVDQQLERLPQLERKGQRTIQAPSRARLAPTKAKLPLQASRDAPAGDAAAHPSTTPDAAEGSAVKSCVLVPADKNYRLRARVGEQNVPTPNDAAPDTRRWGHRRSTRALPLPQERDDFALRRLAVAWTGYPAYLSWYREQYLPWYYGLYGAAVTPPLPTSPGVYDLYQGSAGAFPATFLSGPLPVGPVATSPILLAPALATLTATSPLVAFSPTQSVPLMAASSPSPTATATAAPAATSAPTEALLSFEQPLARNRAPTTEPATHSFPSAGAAVPETYDTAAAAPDATPATTALEVRPSLSAPAVNADPAALPASSSVEAPGSVATLPAVAAVPTLLSTPTALAPLSVTQPAKASRHARRSNGGLAGLGLANFAAFLARPDGTLAAIGGTAD